MIREEEDKYPSAEEVPKQFRTCFKNTAFEQYVFGHIKYLSWRLVIKLWLS